MLGRMSEPPVSPSRAVGFADALRTLSSATQPVVMAALFVLWRLFHLPFWSAAEYCFTAGLFLYVLLRSVAAVLLSIARVQATGLLMKPFSRMVAVGIFAALRYLYGLGLIKSLAVLGVLYIISAYLTARVRRRSERFFAV